MDYDSHVQNALRPLGYIEQPFFTLGGISDTSTAEEGVKRRSQFSSTDSKSPSSKPRLIGKGNNFITTRRLIRDIVACAIAAAIIVRFFDALFIHSHLCLARSLVLLH